MGDVGSLQCKTLFLCWRRPNVTAHSRSAVGHGTYRGGVRGNGVAAGQFVIWVDNVRPRGPWITVSVVLYGVLLLVLCENL